MSFDTYRHEAGYSPTSMRVQDSHLRGFYTWCHGQDILYHQITYNQLLGFVDNERSRGISPRTIARKMNSIRIFFDYLINRGIAKENIAAKIRIRDSLQKAPPEILSPDQLEKIYQDYRDTPRWKRPTQITALLHERNTVALGLLIFQGLDSGQLAKLETEHANLEKSTIYIPSGRKNNARILSLQAVQILPLKTYLENIRPRLLEKHQQQSTRLFAIKKTGDMVRRILDQVRGQHPQVVGSRQMRASVIASWLKTNNIRQVQYMAGHKSIRSTESYRRQDLTGLTRQLELFHPLK